MTLETGTNKISTIFKLILFLKLLIVNVLLKTSDVFPLKELFLFVPLHYKIAPLI